MRNCYDDYDCYLVERAEGTKAHHHRRSESRCDIVANKQAPIKHASTIMIDGLIYQGSFYKGKKKQQKTKTKKQIADHRFLVVTFISQVNYPK